MNVLDAIEWAVRNDVREFDVTDSAGRVTTITLGESVPLGPRSFQVPKLCPDADGGRIA